MVMFAANQSVLGDRERKDTVKNAEETGWFVWNMATYDLEKQLIYHRKHCHQKRMNLILQV